MFSSITLVVDNQIVFEPSFGTEIKIHNDKQSCLSRERCSQAFQFPIFGWAKFMLLESRDANLTLTSKVDAN